MKVIAALLLLLVPSAWAALPAYAISSGSASPSIDTTASGGAKLIVVQCNSFGAGCHGFTDSVSGNTYTAGTLHTNSSFNLKFYWCLSPTGNATETWTSSSSDTVYVSAYPAPSGGSAYVADSGATNFDTSVNNTGFVATLTLTPTVINDVIVTGISDNVAATGSTGTAGTVTGATNAAPSVFTVSGTATSAYIFNEAITVASVSPSAYNGSYSVTALATHSVTGNNGSPPGSAWVRGGTITGSTRFASAPSGSCTFVKNEEFNTASKETGASADSACASTSAQAISWIQTTANFLTATVAFKPLTSGATVVPRHH